MKVKGTINEIKCQSNVTPAGSGRLALSVSREMMKTAGVGVGDRAKFRGQKTRLAARRTMSKRAPQVDVADAWKSRLFDKYPESHGVTMWKTATRFKIVGVEVVGLGVYNLLVLLLQLRQAPGQSIVQNFGWDYAIIGGVLIAVGLELLSLIKHLPPQHRN